MFGFFKKQSDAKKLKAKYNKLMEASYKLSRVNRKESDLKRAEAEEILNQITRLNSEK